MAYHNCGVYNSSVQISGPTDVSITNADEAVIIKWTDPNDIEESGTKIAEWGGTLVVRKEGSAPTSKTDGVVIVDSKVKNEYASVGFTDTSLKNGTKYYYGIFSYTKDGVYTCSYTEPITPSAIYPDEPTGITLESGHEEIKVTFTKPSNATGIRIVYGTREPTSETDGTVINTTKSYYTISNLISNTKYYVKIYSYNGKGRFTEGQVVSAVPKTKLVPWSTGTDQQIEAMVDSYYAGYITLEQIRSVWSVGDSRNITLSAMSATYVNESHASQTVQLTIIGFDHDDLVTPINGKNKALITVQLKDCLNEKGKIHGDNLSLVLWRGCNRRTWCNNTFKNSIPSVIRDLIKDVNKINYITKSSSISTTHDSCFLLSETEIFGRKYLSFGDEEGVQYEYYRTSSNRVKGEIWWTRSLNDDGSRAYVFCGVRSDGTVDKYNQANDAGLIIGFCL